jgi:heat shock protein HslJ
MKKTLFVLPFCMALAFCSRKSVPPPPTGVSNVKVGRGDTMTSAASASSSYTTADRDWAYKANRDTMLNGTWSLNGMLSSGGAWASTEIMDSTGALTTAGDTAMAINTTNPQTGTKTTVGRRGSAKTKNRNALYEGAKTRLKMDYRAGSAIDTTALEPYKYWTRTPTLVLAGGIFSGNTGCNSMSGRVNYDVKDLRFDQKINTSRMACNEYDETNFLTLLKRVDNYTMNGNVLELRQGNTLLLSFKKV